MYTYARHSPLFPLHPRHNEAPRSKLRGINRNYGVANPSSL